jgi:hypothetical protein
VRGDDSVVRLIRETGAEVLAHGWFHHNPARTARARLTGGADEFTSLDRAAAIARARQARAALETVFAGRVRGFVPPAWQWGRLDAPALAEAGYGFGVGWSGYSAVSGRWLPLATRSWDGGRWRWLGQAIDLAGQIRARLTTAAVPCIVLHPIDLARGFWPTALALIEASLAQGQRPLRFGDYA